MKALVVCLTDLSKDPRVSRQIKWLTDLGFSVTTLAEGAAQESVHHHVCSLPPSIERTAPERLRCKIKSGFKLLNGNYEQFYWTRPAIQRCEHLFQTTLQDSFDLIVANDFNTLPLVLRYKRGAKVLLDAHEYAPEEFSDLWKWRLFFQKYSFDLCRRTLPQVDAMMTVNDGIARRYAEVFGTSLPFVLTNAVPYYDLQPSEVTSDKIRLIHHGIAAKSRNIDIMFSLFECLDDRFELDLIMVPGDGKYIERMKEKAKRWPQVRCLPPVPMKEIVPTTNQYDMGVYLLPPVNFNYLYGLPDKLFEFLQARLALALGPSPEMAKVARHYQCGIVSDKFDPKSLATQLNSLDRNDIIAMKSQASYAAKELNAEANSLIFREAVNKAMNR